MKEVIVRLTSDHIKVKNAEYGQDLVRCRDCKYWHSNTEFCDKFSHGGFIAQRMLADDFCCRGEVRDE